MTMPLITDVHLSTDGIGTPIIFPGQKPAGADHQELMDQLIAAVKENPNRKKVTLADGSRWRTQRMRANRYALRRMRDVCPDIDTLGLPQWIKALLLGSKMRETGGLIVICGLTGAGKTTTFSATIAARLRLLGGYCLTIEDPPEDLLEGNHGERGYCEQIDADEVGGYENAIHAALRCFPAKDSSMLGYGEVRDPATAAQLLRVAVDGHLVLMTTHSKTIAAGLQRLSALARAAGEENANELIATSLQLAVHQRFDLDGKLVTSALPRENKVVSHIRQGEFAAVTQEVERVQLSNL